MATVGVKSILDGPDTDSLAHLDGRVRLWGSREARSEELKQLHWPKWRANWSWYRNKVTPLADKGAWWRSNEYIPTPFKIIETILPRYLLGMFDSPDWFTVEARNRRSEEYETLCQNLLRLKVDQMKAFPKVYDAIKYCTIMGHVWGKVLWQEDWMRRKVMRPVQTVDPMTGEPTEGVEERIEEEATFNGPMFDWLPLDKVWPDPSGRERWYIEQIDTTLEELEETQKYRGIYDKVQFAALKASLEGSSVPSGMYDSLGDARVGSAQGNIAVHDREPETTEGIPFSTVAPQNDGVGCTLKQCWGWVPEELRGKDDCEWRLVIIANGQFVIRDIPAPTPDSKPPYFPVRSIRVPGLLYGASILEYIGPMADQQTRLANMRLDEVFMGIWQSLLIRKGALASDNQLYYKPGGFMELNVEPNQAILDNVAIMPRAPLLPQVWQEDSYRQLQAEHTAAASDIMQGVSGSDRQTATEVERKLQQGNARHVLQTMLFGYDFQKELLERTWEWCRMRLTQVERVKLGEEYADVTLSMIQAPIDINVGGGFFALSKQTRLSMDQELVALLAVEQFAAVAKPQAIFKQLLQDRGWKNVERFILTEEEIAAQQQQAQLIAGLQALMGGAGGKGEGQGDMAALAGLSNMQGGMPPTQMAGAPASDGGLDSNPLAEGPV